MKRFLCIILACIMCCLSFASCTKQTTNSDSKSDNDSTSVTDNEDNNEDNDGNEEDSKYPNVEIKNFKIEIDGKKLSFPFAFKEIKDKIKSGVDLQNKVTDYSSAFCGFETQSGEILYIRVSVYNPNNQTPTAFEDCTVFDLATQKSLEGAKGINISLPKNISLGSTYEDVSNNYGTGVLAYETDSTKQVKYGINNQECLLTLGFTDDALEMINLTYVYNDELLK